MISAGSNHLILQNIYLEYKTYNLLELLPEELQKHLKYIYELNSERNIKISKQAEGISGLLNKNGIAHLYTKGMGHIIDGIYANPGGRILGDLDMIVYDKDWIATAEILKKDGYFNRLDYDPQKKKSIKHYPRLIKEGEPAELELHWIAVKDQYSKYFSTNRIMEGGRPSHNYKDLWVMSDEDKIIHNFLHSQLDDRGHRHAHIFLRNLYDMLLLSKREDPYTTIKKFGHFQNEGKAYLALADKVFNSNLLSSGKKSFATNYFLAKHELNLRSKTFLIFHLFIYKIYRHYIFQPFAAVFNKQVRKSFISNIKSKEAWKKHFRSYRKFFVA
ncbi:MAG: nucleotidyltransferase family protein [Bacteroidales bacterium]|nr:nucleotidyltransferase family protein [Bacteroidales bacterium]MCF8389632.1 nucleotidyltransferase family protein [Bacteroidales bacterium]